MNGRFPVPMEEYRQMELAARQPEQAAGGTGKQSTPDADEDEPEA